MLANAVLVVEHLTLFGVERVPQVQHILLFAVDGLAQTEQIPFLVERLRLQPPIQLFQFTLQAALVVLQFVDALLQFGEHPLGGGGRRKGFYRCGVDRVRRGWGACLVGRFAQHAGRDLDLRLGHNRLWRVLGRFYRMRYSRHHAYHPCIARRIALGARRQQLGYQTGRRHRGGRMFPGIGLLLRDVKAPGHRPAHGGLLVDLEGIKSRLGFFVEDGIQAASNRGRVACLCLHLQDGSTDGRRGRDRGRRWGGNARFVYDVIRLDGDFRGQQVGAQEYLVDRGSGRRTQPDQLIHLATKLFDIERLEDILVGMQLESLVLLELGGRLV